jgi:hypothetical protein
VKIICEKTFTDRRPIVSICGETSVRVEDKIVNHFVDVGLERVLSVFHWNEHKYYDRSRCCTVI